MNFISYIKFNLVLYFAILLLPIFNLIKFICYQIFILHDFNDLYFKQILVVLNFIVIFIHFLIFFNCQFIQFIYFFPLKLKFNHFEFIKNYDYNILFLLNLFKNLILYLHLK